MIIVDLTDSDAEVHLSQDGWEVTLPAGKITSIELTTVEVTV